MSDKRRIALASMLTLAAGCASTAAVEGVDRTSQAVAGPVADPKFVYYGGPIIQNVKVVAVWWGAVTDQAQLPAFYSDVTNSAYMDWLSEYGTPGHPIGRGTYAGAASAPTPTSSTIDDTTIKATLASMIAAGTLPAPDANTVYANHFGPGTTVTLGGEASCQQFCSYHGTFVNNGQDAFYTVVPDTTACAPACGVGSELQVTTGKASHALINAITDPGVGLAFTLGPPLAWFDRVHGEVGDICNHEYGTTASGWTVALGWSNYSWTCVGQPSPKASPPSCTTKLACGSAVDVVCAADFEPMTIRRTDPGGSPQTIGGLGPTGGTFADKAPGAKAVYQVCGTYTNLCGAPIDVAVDTFPCEVVGPGPHCSPATCL